MCGIFGVVGPKIKPDSELISISDLQSHRGPDMSGSKSGSIGPHRYFFGHQRLSIFDLSTNGQQPFESVSGRTLMTYNGEVYNFADIRKQFLSGQALSSTSDTPVVIECIEKLGVERAITQFNGMFAIAALNRTSSKLYLVRDRLGKKPLYYATFLGGIAFASEIKTLLATINQPCSVNRNAIDRFLHQSLQDTDESTFIENVRQVSPGHYIEVDLSGDTVSTKQVCYWHPISKPHHNTESTSTDLKDAVAYFDHLFEDSVGLRLAADVPVGSLLSGGLDSSAIAAAALRRKPDMVTMSAVSTDGQFDESRFVDQFDKHFSVQTLRVALDPKASDFLELLKSTIFFNDGPIGSFSNVLLYLLMKEAKKLGITVVLSGQGADEILCGYKKYVPFAMHYAAKSHDWKRFFRLAGSFLGDPEYRSQFNLSEAGRYLGRIPFISSSSSAKLRSKSAMAKIGAKFYSTLAERQVADVLHYSVPYLTHYEDRMSMAFAREIRCPFLDYRLVEYCINLPDQYKIAPGWTKFLLRESQKAKLPPSIVWRKDKQGFLNPQEKWLKRELKSTIQDVLHRDAMVFQYGFLDAKLFDAEYSHFRTGKKLVWYRNIFNPLALEIWLQQNKTFVTG